MAKQEAEHESISGEDGASLAEARSQALGRADWDRVSQVFSQCINAILNEDEPYLPGILPGFLAEVLARVSANYFGIEEQLVNDAEVVFKSAYAERLETAPDFDSLYRDTNFARLAEYQNVPGRRRRPTPFEATVETARRLRDLNSLEAVLKDVTIGAILGGSASYGRFFNVKGAASGGASDIDLLIVLEEYSDLTPMCDRLGSVRGIASESLSRLRRRAAAFERGRVGEDGRAVFSAKIEIWGVVPDPILRGSGIGSGYNVSIHVASWAALNRILLRDLPRISRDGVEWPRITADFREAVPARDDHQRNFGGGNLRLPIQADELAGSFLRRSHTCVIDDEERYHPGMFQNLVLPQFDVRWGSSLLRRSVDSFRWKMVERLRYEQRIRPHDLLRLSLSHTRSEVFAPHTIRSVDNSTHMS